MSQNLTPDQMRQAAQNAWAEVVKWQNSQKSSRPISFERGIEALGRLYQYADIPSYAPILGQLLWLDGEPFSISDYAPFEPLYKRFDRPRRKILKCGRQVAKSTSMAVEGILESAIMSHYQTIYVCPLFEQIRRFSSNYVRKFINDSPVKSALIGESVTGAQNVLQRTFKNGSIMHFTFAFLDANRARGISGDKLVLDEVQDINADFLPVLEYCISASDYRTTSMSGTPKTMDNLIQVEWDKSSKAEWVIRCGCGHWNICSIHFDLDKMIQKDGLVCSKCGKYVNPRTGHYVHQNNDVEVIRDFPGYHIPQPILPLHLPSGECGGVPNKHDSTNLTNWRRIWKAKNSGNQIAYYNECLGESCDRASNLVTLSELKAISNLKWANTVEEAFEQRGRYQHVTMGVDWGGGAGGIVRRVRGVLVVEGGSASFTVLTITGFLPGDTMPQVLYTERLPTSMTPHEEVARILQLFQMFQCYRIAHDFGGAGNLREAMLLQSGFPAERIFPCMYMPAMGGKPIVKHVPAGPDSTRNYYQVDKARSLAMLCQLMKLAASRNPVQQVFPLWRQGDGNINLQEDFLALVEDKRDRPGGADVLLITRHPSKTDDFCHAFNFACLAHWHSMARYPDTAELFQIGLTEQQQASLYPSAAELNWDLG